MLIIPLFDIYWEAGDSSQSADILQFEDNEFFFGGWGRLDYDFTQVVPHGEMNGLEVVRTDVVLSDDRKNKFKKWLRSTELPVNSIYVEKSEVTLLKEFIDAIGSNEIKKTAAFVAVPEEFYALDTRNNTLRRASYKQNVEYGIFTRIFDFDETNEKIENLKEIKLDKSFFEPPYIGLDEDYRYFIKEVD